VRERRAAEDPERHEQQARYDEGADEPAVCTSKQSFHPATSRVTFSVLLPAHYDHALFVSPAG
jgi:hypothetical protein